MTAPDFEAPGDVGADNDYEVIVQVADGAGGVDTQTITVSVTNINEAPSIAANTGLTVAEGATVTITNAELASIDTEDAPAQIVYTITSGPAHGTLSRSGSAVGSGSTFTQDDIDNGRVTYTHDGGETTSDTFGFAVHDAASSGPPAQSFSIAVTPVDDPIAIAVASITVPTDGSAIVDGSMIAVSDPDGPAGPVVFTVQNVVGGHFENVAAEGTPITSFSAADIAGGSIRFVHDPAGPAPGFEVSATDGTTTTAFVAATVTLEPSQASLDALLGAVMGTTTAAPAPAPPAAPAPLLPRHRRRTRRRRERNRRPPKGGERTATPYSP